MFNAIIREQIYIIKPEKRIDVSFNTMHANQKGIQTNSYHILKTHSTMSDSLYRDYYNMQITGERPNCEVRINST
jgi:flavorubredoxin